MANVGQTKPATRDRDLPDPCAEVRELRRMVQERDEEIERLREAAKKVISYNISVLDGRINYRPHCHIDVLQTALGGGGDQDE